MLKILRVLLSVVVIALAGYGLITDNYEFQSYMLLCLGVLSLMTGVMEFQAKRKISALFSIVVAAFVLFVAIYTF